MKIGIITLYYNSKNLGGLLQSYALVSVLQRLGYSAEQICYDFSISNENSRKYQNSRRKALLLSSGYKLLINKIKSLLIDIKSIKKTEICSFVELQNSIFEEFEQYIPHSQQVYNINTIDSCNYYDCLVVGSDQVWNLGLLAHDAMYLNFSNKRKVTYAVSMGKTSITEYEKRIFLSKINVFSEISVREKSLAELINQISDKTCVTVLDPTLLLDYEKWCEIENNQIIPTCKYIFCYFLGDCSWQRKYVQKYADKIGLKIIDIPYILGFTRKSDYYLRSEKHYDIGPREFISLIKNAECVFTDSFHAIAFSANFHTNFYVFDRDGLSGGESINSRITDFLDLLSLSDRRITSAKYCIPKNQINWTSVSKVLEEERTKSITWLTKQLLS